MAYFSIPRSGLVLEVLGDGSFVDTNDGTKVTVTATNTAQNPCGIGYQKTSGFVSGSSGLVTATRAAANEPVTGMMVVDFLATDNAQNKNVFGKSNVVNSDRYGPIVWMGTDGTLYAEIANASTYQRQTLGTSLEDGKWHQVKVRWDGSTFSGSLDNVEIFSVAQTLTVAYTTDNWALLNSAENSSRWCAGSARARLYNRQLSASEELSLWHEFNRKLGGGSDFGAVVPQPDHCWPMFQDAPAAEVMTATVGTTSATALSADRFGLPKGLTFSSQKLEQSITTPSGAYTLAWVGSLTAPAADSSYYRIFDSQNNGTPAQGAPLALINNGSSVRIACYHQNGSWVVITNDLSSYCGSTHKWAFKFTGSNAYVYVDGALIGSVAQATNYTGWTGTARWMEKTTSSGANLNGSLQEAYRWNQALSDDQIKFLHDSFSFRYPYAFRRSIPTWLQGDCASGACRLWLSGYSSGTTLYDLSGRGNNATMVNTPTKIRAGMDTGIGLNGSNQYCTIPDASTLDFTSSFSVFHTVKADSLPTSGNQVRLYGDTSNGGGPYGPFTTIFNNSGTMSAYVGYGSTNSGFFPIPTVAVGKGFSILFVHDDAADADSLYVNGYLVGTNTGKTGNPVATNYTKDLGSEATASKFANVKLTHTILLDYVLDSNKAQNLHYSLAPELF